MNKRLILVLAFAFVIGIAFAAYAEVQNVKVSGDITVGGVMRNNYDLAKTRNIGATTIGAIAPSAVTYSDMEKDLFSIARIRVDADLTDNVSATVRLLNERNWNGESAQGLAENNRNVGLAATNAVDEQDVDLDLAFVTLKEFLYSPLTLKVGRQEMRFGNGWLIGDPDTSLVALRSSLAEGDLSARKSFDAIRATLDYNPLIVDLVYSKVAENNTVMNDDTTLYGLNAAYEMNKNTTVEGFFFSKERGSSDSAAANVDVVRTLGTAALSDTYATSNVIKGKSDIVNTVGARVVNKTVKNLTIDAQAAFQFGTYNPKYDTNARWDSTGAPGAGGEAGEHAGLTSPRRAWGMEVIAAYELKDIQKIAKYNPMIAATYIYLSGESRDKVGNKAYKGWDPMYEDQMIGHILNSIMGFTNLTLGALTMQAKPMDDIGVKVDYVTAWFNKRFPQGRAVVLSGVPTATQFYMGKGNFIGQEIDMTLTYDYTEDVQFSLLGGYFLPSRNINEVGNETATTPNTNPRRAAASEIMGTMKVTF